MKSLIEVKEKDTIFSRIRNFLKTIFSKNIAQQEYNSNIHKSDNNFKQNIKIQEDSEKIRLLELQKKFKNGEIDEYDINDEDYQKLLDLYDEQNSKIRQEIEQYKIETENILKKLRKGTI